MKVANKKVSLSARTMGSCVVIELILGEGDNITLSMSAKDSLNLAKQIVECSEVASKGEAQ